ncbi:DVU0298 family protein [candidate division KSB1 bacterium]
MKRDELEIFLRANKLEDLKDEYSNNPAIIRKLMGFLYHPELELRDAAARGFGMIARVMPMEKLKDLLRRMMWMLNDESGSCSWHVPYAIGEIGFNNPEAIDGFIGCFSHYANDPDDYLSTGVKRALKRIAESGKKFDEEGYVIFRKNDKSTLKK